ncbi:hypothetical protein L5515_002032 [Caenorhabditis briggsae]|nr:hypothetical protein L5515_002032 [Caenorhabditis briggsae]
MAPLRIDLVRPQSTELIKLKPTSRMDPMFNINFQSATMMMPEFPPVQGQKPTPYDKKKDPNHVKRPMNSFMVFSQAERKKITMAQPHLHNAVISQQLSKKWKDMTPEEKDPYVKEADKLKMEHALQNPGYKYQPRRKLKGVPAKSTVSDENSEGKKATPQRKNAQPMAQIQQYPGSSNQMSFPMQSFGFYGHQPHTQNPQGQIHGGGHPYFNHGLAPMVDQMTNNYYDFSSQQNYQHDYTMFAPIQNRTSSNESSESWNTTTSSSMPTSSESRAPSALTVDEFPGINAGFVFPKYEF